MATTVTTEVRFSGARHSSRVVELITTNSTFIIEEMNVLGGAEPPGGFARFEWDARHRNIPLRPWRFGVHQRTKRTDYTGADDPTEQVLGPNFTPFTLTGRFDDRYNPLGEADPSLSGAANQLIVGGYAKKEREKFEAMVRRGNVVRITFEDIFIQGIITDVEFEYFHRAKIGYSFTFSPHHRTPGGFFALERSPKSALNAKQLRSNVSAEIDKAIAVHADSPRVRLNGTIYQDADTLVESWKTSLGSIDRLLDGENLTLETEANAALLRMGQTFLGMVTTSTAMLDLLAGYDSSEAMDFERPIAVMAFDVWSRGLMYHARRIIVAASKAAADLQQRVHPGAMHLYRPSEGEHLMAISTRFYRTPHNWRAIYNRNGLTTTTLSGDELLIIPESTGR